MDNPELTITVLDMKRTSLRSNTGREAGGDVDYDPLRRDTIGVLQDLLARKRMDGRRAFEVLGRQLYEVLLNGAARNLFERMLDESRGKENARLRVQLSFMDEAAELADLPWEYLFHSNPDCFFATSVDLVLSRFLRLDQERDASLNPGEDRLRILIVVSEPEDLAGVLADPVVEAIEKLQERHPIDIAIQRTPTPDRLVESLAETRPHILHFIGHGKFENRMGFIALLQRDEAKVQWCDDWTFGDHLTQAGVVPRLVLLHLCEGGKVDLNANFAGLAPQLVRRNVQAVVAMQHPITNLDAISFSRAFYAEVAKGADVDHAVQVGRWRMTTTHGYSSRGFGTPVLYMRSRSGIIMAPGGVNSTVTGRAGPGSPVGGTRSFIRRLRLDPDRGPGSVAKRLGGIDSDLPGADVAASFSGPGAHSAEGSHPDLSSRSTFEDPSSDTSISGTSARIRAETPQMAASPLRRLQSALFDARQAIRGMSVPEERKNGLLERLGRVEFALLQAQDTPENWRYIVLDFCTGEADLEFLALLDGITDAFQRPRTT